MPFIPDHIVSRLNAINVEAVAEALGVEVRKHQALCFIHPDHTPSLHFHPGKNIWKCFVCNEGGTPISLVMKHRGVGFVEACQWLSGVFGIHIPGNNYRFKKDCRYNRLVRLDEFDILNQQTTVFNKEIGEWILQNLTLSQEAEAFLFKDRKLSREVVNSLNIKSISSGTSLRNKLLANFSRDSLVEAGYIKVVGEREYIKLFTPCLIFPYYDKNGVLVGLQSRYIGANRAPRFMFITGFQPSFFNIGITNHMRKGEDLYIAEGVTDCLALLSSGLKAIALPSASVVPLDHIDSIIDFNLIMSVDRDEDGAGERVYDVLDYNIMNSGGRICKLDFPPEFKDYGEYYKTKF